MVISVQNKKSRYIRGGRAARVLRRTAALDGLTPTARSNYVRWFDPTVGRWLSEDPAAADENLYRYCGNAPTDGTDPSGTFQQPQTPPRPPLALELMQPPKAPEGTPENNYQGVGEWSFKTKEDAWKAFEKLLDQSERPQNWKDKVRLGCIGLNSLRVGTPAKQVMMVQDENGDDVAFSCAKRSDAERR